MLNENWMEKKKDFLSYLTFAAYTEQLCSSFTLGVEAKIGNFSQRLNTTFKDITT